MALSLKHRRMLLGLALFATLVAAFAPEQGQPVAATTVAAQGKAARLSTKVMEPEVPEIAIRRPAALKPSADPFSPETWRPAVVSRSVVSSSVPAALEPAVAPTLPYRYLGRVDDSGRALVLLGNSEKSVAVQVGDLIDGAWHVEDITARTLEILYRPLGQRQSVIAGSEQ